MASIHNSHSHLVPLFEQKFLSMRPVHEVRDSFLCRKRFLPSLLHYEVTEFAQVRFTLTP